MCTRTEVREEIKEALKENNVLRDQKWEARFSDMLELVETSIEKRIKHLHSSPETQREINKINLLCAQRGVSLDVMQKDITEIKEAVATINNKLDGKYAAKWTEWVVAGTLVIFALAALYYVFAHVGLPKP